MSIINAASRIHWKEKQFVALMDVSSDPSFAVLFRHFTERAQIEMKNSDREVSSPKSESRTHWMPMNSAGSVLCSCTLDPIFSQRQSINPPRATNVSAKLVPFGGNVSAVTYACRNCT